MSRIKSNFLWMIYRCGWAGKENQERVLAIWIDKAVLILAEAVHSSFDPSRYSDHAFWKGELEKKDVRLQFGKEQVKRIEDVTEFVKEQKKFVDQQRLDLLQVPVERVWEIEKFEIKRRVGV